MKQSVRIILIVEGSTEQAFLPYLRSYLCTRLEGRMPKIITQTFHKGGRIPKGKALKKIVERLLNEADYVIALTDVYTGSNPHDFESATDAKENMRMWVGNNRFYAHAAQYEFEAWLLPFWNDVRKRIGATQPAPAGCPEEINHDKPPSKRLRALFQTRGQRYKKAVDAPNILRSADLSVAIAQCPELKAFVNTILSLSGGETIA